jgi:hypothetical protein
LGRDRVTLVITGGIVARTLVRLLAAKGPLETSPPNETKVLPSAYPALMPLAICRLNDRHS